MLNSREATLSAGIQGAALLSPLQCLCGSSAVAPGPDPITGCTTVQHPGRHQKPAVSLSSSLSGWEQGLLFYTRTMAQPQTASKKTSAGEQTVRGTPWLGTKYGRRTWNSLSFTLLTKTSARFLDYPFTHNWKFSCWCRCLSLWIHITSRVLPRQATSEIIWQKTEHLSSGKRRHPCKGDELPLLPGTARRQTC